MTNTLKEPLRMEDDLFDLGVAQVVRSGGDSTTKAASTAWATWCDLTKRPDRSRPDRKFLTAYRALLARHVPTDQGLRLVRAAACVPPHGRDAADLRRLLKVLEGGKPASYALAQLDSGAEPILFPVADPTHHCTTEQVEAALGTLREDWTHTQRESAAVVMETFDAEGLKKAAEEVRLMLGTDVLLPGDLLRNRRSAKRGTVARNDRRGTFESGRAEQSVLEGLALGVDPAAKRAHRQGAKASEVRRFHELAPAGYWDAVMDVMDEESADTPEQAYELLVEKWGFHPDDRPEIGAGAAASMPRPRTERVKVTR